jgi:ubiquinone/menaquinone biosynthesis C-methylase UbiE
MKRPPPPAPDAVEWHSQVAARFDGSYASRPDFIERYNLWTRLIARYSDCAFRALDLGCGSGALTLSLAEGNASVLGIDASPEMLRLCSEKLEAARVDNVTLAQCRIDALHSVVDAPVDLVVCSSVLEYVTDLDGSLETVSRCIKDSGILMLSMPNSRSLYRKLERLAFRAFRMPKYYQYVRNVCTLEDVQLRLELLGFETLESAYYGAVPLVSTPLRRAGLGRYCDNLFVIVAARTCPGP